MHMVSPLESCGGGAGMRDACEGSEVSMLRFVEFGRLACMCV